MMAKNYRGDFGKQNVDKEENKNSLYSTKLKAVFKESMGLSSSKAAQRRQNSHDQLEEKP